MKKPLTSLVFLLIFLLSTACDRQEKKSEAPEIPSEIKAEELSEAQRAFWDEQENVTVGTHEIFLPNGLSVDEFLEKIDPDHCHPEEAALLYEKMNEEERKNFFIAQLISAAHFLTDDSNFIFDHSSPIAQKVLGYSFGSKDHQSLQNSGACRQEIYGLDAAGFIYQSFVLSGLPLNVPTYTGELIDATCLEKMIRSEYPALKNIRVEDLGKLAPSQLQSGDLVYWFNADSVIQHTGMVLKGDGRKLYIAQSNGSPSVVCEKNAGPRRGPRITALRPALEPPAAYGFSDRYRIVRIHRKISGKWKLTLKCREAANEMLSLALNFPTSKNTSFGEKASYFCELCDSQKNLVFDFTYHQLKNELTCTFESTSENDIMYYRNDHFTIALTQDMIGYFPATLGENYNAGCPLVIRLENRQVPE